MRPGTMCLAWLPGRGRRLATCSRSVIKTHVGGHGFAQEGTCRVIITLHEPGLSDSKNAYGTSWPKAEHNIDSHVPVWQLQGLWLFCDKLNKTLGQFVLQNHQGAIAYKTYGLFRADTVA